MSKHETDHTQRQLRNLWNERYAEQDRTPRPAEVLLLNRHLLPKKGVVLDLACGLGGNALTLARYGLDVLAWDISPVAIERLREYAKEEGVANLKAEVRDVENHPPQTERFDLIIVSYYLERALIAPLIEALKPGGLIFYQTFTQVAVSPEGPKNSLFRLDDNELLELFRGLKLRFYREEGLLGDVEQGCRNVAMLVAEKP